MDLPLGQRRPLVEPLSRAKGSEGYVGQVSRPSKEELRAPRKTVLPGVQRAARVPLPPGGPAFGLEQRDEAPPSADREDVCRGAPRLLRADVSVEPCPPAGSEHVAVEASPAVAVHRYLGKRSYMSGERKKQAPIQRAAREELAAGLGAAAREEACGFVVGMDGSWRERSVREPGAYALDSPLCGVRARWGYTKRDEGWGAPEEYDRDKGWILDPQLLVGDG
jgi:hypothetical protein